VVFRLRSGREQFVAWFGDVAVEIPAINLISSIRGNF